MNTKGSSAHGTNRAVLWIAGLIGLGVLYLLAVTVIPRWWA